jgi:hypothetical protein
MTDLAPVPARAGCSMLACIQSQQDYGMIWLAIVQAGILATVSEHAFVLAAKLGAHEHACFPEKADVAQTRLVLERLHTMTLDSVRVAAADGVSAEGIGKALSVVKQHVQDG